MTSTKFAMLKLSIVCAMGLGTSAIVPAAAAADGYRAEATLATVRDLVARASIAT